MVMITKTVKVVINYFSTNDLIAMGHWMKNVWSRGDSGCVA